MTINTTPSIKKIFNKKFLGREDGNISLCHQNREGIRQGWKPASLVEELVRGGLQEADSVHGGAVWKLHHQPGAFERKTHPGREHR